MEHLTQPAPDDREAKKSFRSEATERPAGRHAHNRQVSALDARRDDAPLQRKADQLALARWEGEGGRLAAQGSFSADGGEQPVPARVSGHRTPALLAAKSQRTAIMAQEASMQDVTFKLAEIADELAREPALLREGHTARTLVRSQDLRVLLVAVEQGKKIAEHHADVTAIIQVVRGHVRVRLSDRSEELGPAQLLWLAPGTRHELYALADSAFVLTLGWSSH